MKAKVTESINGRVKAIVRRGFRAELIDGINPTLKVGDVVEVTRKTNNPFLVIVKKPIVLS